MEERAKKPVMFSLQYAIDTQNIFDYGQETFGVNQAIKYETLIDELALHLEDNFAFYPECRWLKTKSRMYRNIILDSHLIIYRIKQERIEVLRVIHANSSINKIKQTRKVKI